MYSVLITGANRGIGLEFSKQYLDKGYQVFACCRNTQAAESLKELEKKYSGKITILHLDLEDSSSILKLGEHLNGKPIDILINNSGIFTLPEKNFDLNTNAWLKFFQINSVGPYLVSNILLNNLAESQRKLIINISSDMGSIQLNQDGSHIPYRASKAALNAITKSFALTYATRNLSCIALHPGWVRTDMGGPQGRLSVEESVSAMISLIDQFSLDNSGKYYSYNGNELPW